MITKLKDWLYRKYLPAKAKETVWAENKALRECVRDLERKNEVETAKAYAAGMAYALRHLHISVRGEVD